MDGMKEALMNQAIDMFKVKCKELSVPVEIADILVSMINKDTEGLKVNLCLLIEQFAKGKLNKDFMGWVIKMILESQHVI